jgi:hypothetical protein
MILLPMILVRNQIRDMLGGETGKITFGKLSINLGLRAIRIPVCVQYIGTVGGCGLQGYCCSTVYDGACHAEGFGLLS